MIDLHSHTTASDGTLSPSELAEHAAERHVSVLAVTDHDTVGGLQEAEAACARLGITFVPGIEISMAWPQGELHLLGLGIRTVSREMQDLVRSQQEERLRRNERIVRKMNEAGIRATLSDIAVDESGNPVHGTVGRPHFAEFLRRRGIVRTRQQAFDKYLGYGRPYYEAHSGAQLGQAVSAIVSCGAVPVLAHPLSLCIGWSALEERLVSFKGQGVRGIEAWHSGARAGDCARLEALARAHGLFVTAGSDFHGPAVRADRHLGHTAGDKKIDSRFYFEELLPNLMN